MRCSLNDRCVIYFVQDLPKGLPLVLVNRPDDRSQGNDAAVNGARPVTYCVSSTMVELFFTNWRSLLPPLDEDSAFDWANLTTLLGELKNSSDADLIYD